MSLNPAATLRKLRPDESGLYRDFLLSLDPQTRRDRFCGGVSDAYLSQYAQRSLNSNALLYGCFQDDQLCGGGGLHADAPGEPAEAAFVVSPGARHHGIGAALLDVIVLAARNRNHPVIRVTCLPTNVAMHRLAQKADARLILSYDEAVGEIYAPRPNALSWLREAFADAFDMVIYTMQWPPETSPAM